MNEIEIINNHSTQEALQKLRTILGYSNSSELDACNLIAIAGTRINRLTEQLNGTYDPEEAKQRLGL